MPEELSYHSMAGLVQAAAEAGQPLSALVLRQQAVQLEQPEEEVYHRMQENFRVMAACIEPGCDPDLRSTSGLTGGDAYKMRRRVEAGQNLTGPVLGGALYRALAVSELNAAMAAAALVELSGGTPQMLDDAVAIALKCQLGLVCDPVAGLVEIPCIKRNASGAAIAFMAAELALAGIGSRIPADDAILAMRRVGDTMPSALKETAEGGLATTPTACRLFKQVFG